MDLDAQLDRQILLLEQFESFITDELEQMERATQTMQSLLEVTSKLKGLQAERLEPQNSSLRNQAALDEEIKAEFGNLMGELILGLCLTRTRMPLEQSNTCLSDQLAQLKSHMLGATDAINQMDDILTDFHNRLGKAENIIELWMGELKAGLYGTRTKLQEQSNTCLSDELAQFKAHILRATDAIKRVNDKLKDFHNRLGEAENIIELCCAAENLETRFFEKEKELVGLESEANNVVDVSGNHLGTYTIVYNVISLMLLKHVECTWSLWVCAVLAFVLLLVLQVGISYSKIHMIGRTRGSLIKQLTDFQREAMTLGQAMRRPLSLASQDVLQPMIFPVECHFLFQGAVKNREY